MNLLHWLARPEFASLAAALLHFVWQGALIAFLLAAGKRLWRIERPAQRYACSLIALLAMIICPAVTYFAAAPAWQKSQSQSAGEFDGLMPGIATAESFGTDLRTTHWPSIETLARAARPYLLGLWLVGVCVLGTRLAGGLVGVWLYQRRRLPLPAELAGRVERLGKSLGMETLSRVFLSRHIGEALALGFWRPVVLVPAVWVTEMPLEALEAIIAHELAHLRRFDLWVNLLQRVVETLFFYHPAVWWVSRQLGQEREMCCDELAVGATGARVAYVKALELVARERLAGVRPALAAGIRGESNMKLLARVRNVLGGANEDSGSLWPAGVLALLLPLAMWAVTWGICSPAPAAVVADEGQDDDDDRDEKRGSEVGRDNRDRDDDDDGDDDDGDGDDDDDGDGDDDDDERERKSDRKDGDRERKGDEESDRDDDSRERKEVRKDGDQPRREGERRDGDEPKKGPRDGEQPKKGPRDGEAPKKGQRDDDGDKDPVKKEIRKDRPDGEAPKKKIVKEGDAPRKEDPKAQYRREGDGAAKLEAMIKELRAENEKLRAELRELKGEKVVKPGSDKEVGDKKEAVRDELIRKFGDAGERAAIEKKRRFAADEELRAAIEKKKQFAADQDEKAAIEKKKLFAAEQNEKAAIEKKKQFAAEQNEKERDAAARKEREFDRRREEERDRADKEQEKK
jgi:beta-lactamase regulating signal transducer with metallopeptidase domain